MTPAFTKAPTVILWSLAIVSLGLLMWSTHQWIGNLDLATLQMWQMSIKDSFANQPIMFSVIYFVAFTAITACCLPGASILMITCSGCMGLIGCTVLSTLASATGALITMLTARHFFRLKVEKKWPEKIQKFDQGLANNEVPFLISLRLAPVIPFIAFNLLAGITKVKVWRFFWTSAVGMLPGTMVYVNAGFHLSSVNSIDDFFEPITLISIFALAVVPWILQAIFKNRNATHTG